MLSLNSASSLREPKVRGNLVILGLSLRGFEKAVAISLFLACYCEALKKPWQSQYGEHCAQSNACHCENRRFVAILVWEIIINSWNSFYFLFLYWLLVVVDCFVVSLLAMTKKEPSLRELILQFVAISLFLACHCESQHPHTVIARVRRTRGNLVMATATPNPHCHCEALKKPWQSINLLK